MRGLLVLPLLAVAYPAFADSLLTDGREGEILFRESEIEHRGDEYEAREQEFLRSDVTDPERQPRYEDSTVAERVRNWRKRKAETVTTVTDRNVTDVTTRAEKNRGDEKEVLSKEKPPSGVKRKAPLRRGVPTAAPEAAILAAMLPDDDLRVVVAQRNGLDIATEAERCVNYHRAQGKLMIDWASTFRNWLLNAVQYAARDGKQPPPASSPGKPPTPYF